MFDQVEESPHRRQSEDRPFTYLHGDVTKGCIILCDHASNALPSAYGLLGLSKGELARHIAYDIGAAGVARELSQLMDAPAVMANFSRLLIDPNRGEDDPTLVMQLSDGVVVPGNANIDMAEVEFRKAHFYEPYHNAIDSLIDEAIGTQVPPVLVSIHSFTERFKGRVRPWHAGILWDKDDRLPEPLIEALRGEKDIIVGENEPYSGELKGDCLYRHGTQRGLAHGLIELRQDLISEPSGQYAWAQRLARILTDLLSRPSLAAEFREPCYFGSKTDQNSADSTEERHYG